jgi:hypothetical protein
MNLTEQDLLQTCSECNGTGKDPSPQGQQSGSLGRTTLFGHSGCHKCEGVGRVPTQTGKAIIELMRVAFKQSQYGIDELGPPRGPLHTP